VVPATVGHDGSDWRATVPGDRRRISCPICAPPQPRCEWSGAAYQGGSIIRCPAISANTIICQSLPDKTTRRSRNKATALISPYLHGYTDHCPPSGPAALEHDHGTAGPLRRQRHHGSLKPCWSGAEMPGAPSLRGLVRARPRTGGVFLRWPGGSLRGLPWVRLEPCGCGFFFSGALPGSTSRPGCHVGPGCLRARPARGLFGAGRWSIDPVLGGSVEHRPGSQRGPGRDRWDEQDGWDGWDGWAAGDSGGPPPDRAHWREAAPVFRRSGPGGCGWADEVKTVSRR
jgi:hypothetical protein